MLEQRRFAGAFAVAIAVTLISQVLRLQQTSAGAWLLCDYAGRLVSLLVLYLAAETRDVAFAREPLRVDGLRAGGWTLALIAFQLTVAAPIGYALDVGFPHLRLGHYPTAHSVLYVVDMTLGLALVAVHEEILFRRCARHLSQGTLGDGIAMILATAALFALYHWQFGLGGVAGAFLFGVGAMLLYRHVGSILPAIVAHYVADLVIFA